jgi:hypothetical protein
MKRIPPKIIAKRKRKKGINAKSVPVVVLNYKLLPVVLK